MGKAGKFVILIIIVLLTTSFCGCFEDESSWGDDGELLLEIFINPNTIKKDQDFNVTLNIINGGSTDLRVLYPGWFIPPNLIIIKDANGTILRCNRAYEPPPDPNNNDLTVLKPSEKMSSNFKIFNDMYDLEMNKDYTVQGKYKVDDYNTVTLLYWQGEIYSETVTLIVI